MSDVSLSHVVSFLDVDDLTTVVEQVRAADGERTKRVQRDGRTFLFAAPAGESNPTEVVWIDAAAEFDERTVEVFAERCESRGVDGTLLTTGDEERARETLALAFASEDQLVEPDETDEEWEPRLAVPVDDVDVPVTLRTLDDLVEGLEDHELGEDVVEEYHEPHEPDFEDIVNEIDAAEEETAAESADSGGFSGLALALVVLVVLVVVAAAVFFGVF